VWVAVLVQRELPVRPEPQEVLAFRVRQVRLGTLVLVETLVLLDYLVY